MVNCVWRVVQALLLVALHVAAVNLLGFAGVPTCAAAAEISAKDELNDRLIVGGDVVDSAGKPSVKSRMVVQTYPDEIEIITDELGHFEFSAPLLHLRGRSILAYGNDGEQIGYYELPSQEEEIRTLKPLRIQLKPTVSVRMHVTDNAGQPVADALCGLWADHVMYSHGKTDEEGRAQFRIPADAQLHNVFAVKSALGIDYRTFFDPAKHRAKEPQVKPSLKEPFELKLEGAQTIRVRAIDDLNEQPIAGASIYLWLAKKPGESDNLNLSFLTRQLSVKTDEKGWATFDWIPAWEERNQLTFWSTHDDYGQMRGTYDLDRGEGVLVMRHTKLVKLLGKVTYPDGLAAKGIAVRVAGAGYGMDSFRRSTKTDADGRYEIEANPNMIYLVVALDAKWGATRDGFALWPGQPREDVDLVLQASTRVYGQATVGADRQPVKDFRITSYQFGKYLRELKDIQLPNLENSRNAVRPMIFHNAVTNDQGKYEFFVGPGSFDIRGPTQTGVQKFQVVDQKEFEFNFHSARPEEGMLEGVVVNAATGSPIANAKISGIYRHALAGGDLQATADAEGKFRVTRELHRTVLYARTQDQQMAGVIEIEPDDQQVKIPIQPVGSAVGILIDKHTKLPAAGKKIEYGIKLPLGGDDAPWHTAFGGYVFTDNEGKFVLEHLVQGKEYEAHVMNDDRHSYAHVTEIAPKNAEPIELGRVEYSPSVPER